MIGNEANAADIANEQNKLVEEHRVKTLHTTEVLMNQLNMQLYWDNLKEKYEGKKTTIESLSKVMARNLKLYSIIDQIIKIYDLIGKMEEVHRKALIAKDLSSFRLLDQKLCQRLIANIKVLSKDNPIMPTGFQFKGKCMLTEAQKKLRHILIEKKMAMNLKRRIITEKERIRQEKEATET